ncbi:MAG: patatin-like phospholipase family protein, partial [Pacificimonas sp.]
MSILTGEYDRSFDRVGFSGGGLRCFWQGGAVDALRQAGRFSPTHLAAASGGALTAASVVADRGHDLKTVFRQHIEAADDNVRWSEISEDQNMTPHQALYADVVHEILDDDGQRRVANGPAFEVLLTKPPAALPIAAASAMIMSLYQVDKMVRSTPHGMLAEAAGAEALWVDARQAAADGLLADLVCIAATIPPVFDIKDWKGDRVIDAGIIDNAPLP